MKDRPENVAFPDPFVLTGDPAPERVPGPVALDRLTETPEAPSEAWTVTEKFSPTARLAGGCVPNESAFAVIELEVAEAYPLAAALRV